MNILLFTGFYLPGFKGGGPIRTIVNMVEALGCEVNFSIVTRDRDLGDARPYSGVATNIWQYVGKAQVYYISPSSSFHRTIKIIRGFQGNVMHLNSFFSFRFSILPLLLSHVFRRSMKVVIGPRGEFSTGALTLKSVKKFFFISFIKFSGLYKNVTWHASSDYEAADIRRVMGSDVKIHIATDIALPGADLPLSPRVYGTPLRIIFISRISPMKNLLQAIKILQQVCGNIQFDVYGPAEDNAYWTDCQKEAAVLASNIKFQYHGSLDPTEIAKTLAQYDLFFLPTLGENFGHVIAEALSSGVPVLISDATPWRNLAEKNIGWDIPLNQPERFVARIEECCSKPSAEYDSWRQNIRAWAVQNIGNHDAIEQNLQLFNNLN